jgi:O-antigen/teichoic acid export membrane protein
MLAILLPTLLSLWLKTELEPISIMVGQILCLGVFANSIGSMYYSLLHAKGRADITAAKLHMIELPIFLAALFFLLHKYGITGAAWAWVGRMVFDAAALAWCTKVTRS